MCGAGYALRFPAVLREALRSGIIALPDALETEFDEIPAYRGVTIRGDGPPYPLDRSDFLSQMERKQQNPNFPADPGRWENYSCSCFTEMDELMLSFHLPRKGKRIAKGPVSKTQGACVADGSPHIHWFLYEGADPSPLFSVIEVDKNE